MSEGNGCGLQRKSERGGRSLGRCNALLASLSDSMSPSRARLSFVIGNRPLTPPMVS